MYYSRIGENQLKYEISHTYESTHIEQIQEQSCINTWEL